jgi:3-mercaptopyruvate sulfurtransferase SseA
MLTIAFSLSRITVQAQDSSPSALAFFQHLTPWEYILGASGLLILAVLFMKIQQIPSHFRAKGKSTLDPEQLEGLMTNSPPQIVDLRPREQFEGKKGYIRGALNIPYTEFRKRIDELDTSHPRPIVLVDETDKFSHELIPLLERQGHRWLYVLKGGYRAWRRSKYPIYHLPTKPKK